ncbi:MAG: DUF1599 domain-containing protein [Bacteroidota bacterium]
MEKTLAQYKQVISRCEDLFLKKARDYGLSWSILRMPSVTDQILIKAERIRSIQEKNLNMVGESIDNEFVGIINYAIIALILFDHYNSEQPIPDNAEELASRYSEKVQFALDTMRQKNHDYGEAWRKMRVSSMTDLILMKINRLKQIEDNKGNTLVSEGADANYVDILNYAAFCLILMDESSSEPAD